MKKIRVRLILAMACFLTIVFNLFCTPTSIAIVLNAYLTTDTNFTILADGIKTTYRNEGYETVLKVGETEYPVKNGTGTGDSVVCNTELFYNQQEEYIKVTYKVTNNSSEAKTIGVATFADIEINNNDYAEITNMPENIGFTMSDGGYIFKFIGKRTSEVTDVDTYWFGSYGLRKNNKWNNSYVYEEDPNAVRKYDSGMAFSWKNRNIEPDETLTFSVLISIGNINTSPILTANNILNKEYYTGNKIEISGTVKDPDTDDVVTIKYSIDGGEEKELGTNYIPNGAEINYSEMLVVPENLTQGEHYIEVWAVDSVNNKSQKVRLEFRMGKDENDPVVTHTLSPSDWTNGNVTIRVEATDIEGEIKEIELPDGTIVKDDNAEYVVSNNGDYIFIVRDKGGNSVNYPVKVENIDVTEPTINVTPMSCNWSKKVDINLDFTDGQSGFKQYQYAITDSILLPTSWSTAITQATDTITIYEEGTKYLHIKVEDNLGNQNIDKVCGPYFIDKTKPTLNITGDFSTRVIQYLPVVIQANDVPSGIKQVIVGDTILTDENVTFIKNGRYIVQAEDNAGNVTTEELNIENIYYECTADKGHPEYSSSLDKCPVCEAIEGLEITGESCVYDKQEHRVIYNNPNGLTIVEYYNGTTELPKQAGEYEYELKIILDGIEYSTGIKGNYTINPKELTIEDLIVQDKIYDGTDNMIISGGRIIGICTGDTVNFTLPSIVHAENKNVGDHKITIENIILNGEDSKNYILVQPTYGTITAKINPKQLTCEGISGKTKKYDGTKLMEIEGGTLIGVIEGDDVTPNIPQNGTAESENVGEWNITIENITLIGEDSNNYILVQPTEIKGTIEENTNPENPENPEDPNVTKKPLIKIESNIVQVNTGTIQSIKEANVHYKDKIKAKIKIKNIGEADGYVSKIIATLPNGMKFVENSETNNKYGWQINVDGKIETTKYSKEKNPEGKISGTTQEEAEILEVELELQVIEETKENKEMPVKFELEQQDLEGNVIAYTDENKENKEDTIIGKLKYFDISIDKKINKLILTYVDTNNSETFNVKQADGEIVKMDVSEKRANSSIATLKYTISLTNNGNETGTINKIIDMIPKGMTFKKEDNPDWKVDNSGNAIYTKAIEIEEGKTKTIDIALRWDLRKYNLGVKTNKVYIESDTEIDNVLIKEDKLKIEKSNNMAESSMVFSLPTGETIVHYVIPTILIVSILGIGIYGIKRYMLK